MFFPNSDNEIVGHGAMTSYGVTDWLEIGATGNYIDATNDREFAIGGPLVRIRLLKDEGCIPSSASAPTANTGRLS